MAALQPYIIIMPSSSEQIMFGDLYSTAPPTICELAGQFWQLEENIVQRSVGPARNGRHEADQDLVVATAVLQQALAQYGADIQIDQRYYCIPTEDGRGIEYLLQGPNGRISFVLTPEIYDMLDSARRQPDGSLGVLTVVDFSLAREMGYEAVMAAFAGWEEGDLLAWAPLPSLPQA